MDNRTKTHLAYLGAAVVTGGWLVTGSWSYFNGGNVISAFAGLVGGVFFIQNIFRYIKFRKAINEKIE